MARGWGRLGGRELIWVGNVLRTTFAVSMLRGGITNKTRVSRQSAVQKAWASMWLSMRAERAIAGHACELLPPHQYVYQPLRAVRHKQGIRQGTPPCTCHVPLRQMDGSAGDVDFAFD